jgi:hypothetical protein
VSSSTQVYDRAYLLGDAKRNDVLALWEVLRYGSDSFGDPDHLSIYGLRPAEWHARGVRLLARTAVECTRDQLADLIGRDVATVAARAPTVAAPVVVDPFAGSANTLYWIARHLAMPHAVGFEQDAGVFDATRRNLAILGLDLPITRVGYETGLQTVRLVEGQLLVVFLAPPWGDALSEASGLDLRRTTPPVPDIVDVIASAFAQYEVLIATQVHETVTPRSLEAVQSRCDSSALKIYELDAPGQNHGLLLSTLGWTA